MKTIILFSVLLSTTAFAQSMDVNQLKSLLTSRKSTLEAVHAGMSKRLTEKDTNEKGCAFKMVTTQNILKVEASRMLVFTKEKFSPANTPACREAGYTSSTEDNVLSYQPRPSVATELEALDAIARDVRSIVRSGGRVTLTVTADAQTISLTYDLSKSSFRYLVEDRGAKYNIIGEDLPNIDPKSVNLKEVYFCDSDKEEADCTLGDWSDLVQ